MIIFRVAQGIACTSQTTVSDPTINGMPGRLKHRSTIRFRPQTISGEHTDFSVTSQPRNQFPLDDRHNVLDVESNSQGIFYGSPTTNLAGTIEKVGPNAN